VSLPAPPVSPWRFYFDFISPYAYLGWTQIRSIAAQHGRELEPVPILFAALLDANGQKGPAEIPSKRRYLFKDIARRAHRLGVGPVLPPPAHPFNPLLSLRVASLPLDRTVRERIVDALFDAVWTKREPIDAADPVVAVLDRAGLDGRALVSEAQTSEAKHRLRTATEAALVLGVFGVPTVEADGEIFWGTDSLVDLELFASGKGPTFSPTVWDLPVAAKRRGLT
jgi:2-hydroxychromene-2-carboxylate isomerase